MTAKVRRPFRAPILRRALLLPFVLAWIAAGLLTVAPTATAPVSAASPQLSVTTDATYDVRPADHLVHVTLDSIATAHTVDTITTRYYFTSAFLQVLPGTSGYRASAGSRSLGVTVAKRSDQYVTLQVAFGQNVYSGQSLDFRVEFDLVDQGTTPGRLVHVGDSFVSFPVWAFASADTPGSTVVVRFPAGYVIQQEVGKLPGPTVDSAGNQVFKSGRLADPFSFFVWLTADRPGALDTTTLSLPQAGITTLQIQAWADDPAWGRQVGDLFSRGLPVLETMIGLGKPALDHLAVEEAASRTLGGYSGLFDPTTATIQVAYYADPFVILHEASHVWFNADLLADRWIDEAFASYYAQLAATSLKLTATANQLTPDLMPYKIQLNDWLGIGREDPRVEDYAYAATLKVAQLIGDRAGQAGLRTVWQSIKAGEASYQPPQGGQLETLSSPRADWRTLLDQLEQRTGKSFTDIWSEWVVSDSQQALLIQRAAAIKDYATTVSVAGSWALPRSIRSALGGWDFSTAEDLMTLARSVVTQRDAIALRAKAIGVTPPPTLREDFTGAGGLGGASTEATAELQALDALEAAQALSQRDGGLVATIGLLGSHAADDLAAARSAFAAGSLDDAIRLASTARHDWNEAVGTGQGRLVVGILVAVGVLVLLALIVFSFRRRRRTAGLAAAAAGRLPMVSPLEHEPAIDRPSGLVPGADASGIEPPGQPEPPEPAQGRPPAGEDDRYGTLAGNSSGQAAQLDAPPDGSTVDDGGGDRS